MHRRLQYSMVSRAARAFSVTWDSLSIRKLAVVLDSPLPFSSTAFSDDARRCCSGARFSCGAECAAGNAAAIATYSLDAAGNRTAAWDRYSNQSRTWNYPTATSNRSDGWRRNIWAPGDRVAWNWGGAGGTSPGQRVSETGGGYSRSFAYWPNGDVASVSVSDSRGYSYYTSANDHRGRRMFTRNVASTGVVDESWFVYDDSDNLIGVRHYSGGTVRDELFFYADREPVFRAVLDNGYSEVERTF